MAGKPISFLAFFLMWAKVMGWKVPMLHVRICIWLEEADDPVRVLMVFRGAAKSTIFAVYKAWKLYRDRTRRNLIWSADKNLGKKLSRDTVNVLRRHPLCGGMLPTKPGAQEFWVAGALDARNASMNAVGVDQNVTGARADDIDYDDVEVPKNIKTPEAREELRNKIQEAIFIIVPGGQETFIGTPHTHDSLYTEQVENGAALLKIPLFESQKRYEDTTVETRYHVPFTPGADGLWVVLGIHKAARVLVEGVHYTRDGEYVVFPKPPGAVLDIYAHNAWPERFDRAEVERRRRRTKTLNYWDSQYMLEAKPITECELDPDRMKLYAVHPEFRRSNGGVIMMLGNAQIVSGRAFWDPSRGSAGGDDSAFSMVLDDAFGNHYWHVCETLSGDYAEFADTVNTKILRGQVMQICELVRRFNILHIKVETNGVGTFTHKLLRRALIQEGLSGCAVKGQDSTQNKNRRILEAFDGPLKSGVLWAHIDVYAAVKDQMRDWKFKSTTQSDDKVDSGAGALAEAPVRINRTAEKASGGAIHNWRQSSGVHDVTLEFD